MTTKERKYPAWAKGESSSGDRKCFNIFNTQSDFKAHLKQELCHNVTNVPGADPGFLERRFICMNVWGSLLILSHFP